MIQLDSRSKYLRRQIARTMYAAQQGHIASAFSLVEILRVLFDDVLNYDAQDPKCPGRDRLILSKGHGALALYVLLADKGFISEDELLTFCKANSRLGGHPSHHIPGVECSTGSLGHGLPIGVGMALANRDRRVFVVVGDGECQEGSTWEAAMVAGHHVLNNLTIIVDCNRQQSYGPTREIQSMQSGNAWRAFGCVTATIDGHDIEKLRDALDNVPYQTFNGPNVIECLTVKGAGVSFIENNLAWHHRNQLTDAEYQAILAELEG